MKKIILLILFFSVVSFFPQTGQAQTDGDILRWNATGNKFILEGGLIKPFITVGGTDAARTFTVRIRNFSNGTITDKRFIVHWWVSTSSYGSVSKPANQTITFGNGSGTGALNLSGTVDTPSFCTSLTDTNGEFTVISTNSMIAPTGTIYFHVEVQGTVFVASGTVNITVG